MNIIIRKIGIIIIIAIFVDILLFYFHEDYYDI